MKSIVHPERRLFPRHVVLALAVLAFAAAGCDALKAPTLTLEADRTTISAGGHEYAEITATVMNKGKAAANVEVEFATETGSFSTAEDVTSQYVATNAQGLAVVRLYSPAVQGQSEVTAIYYDDESGLEASGRVTIAFGPPQAGNLPVAGKFHLVCAYQNLGAFRSGPPDIQVPCNLEAQTSKGDTLDIENLTVFFLAEAGTLESVTGEEYEVLYKVIGGHGSPVDVDPIAGEPNRIGTLGKTRNPRDGVVTLMAITQGGEAFMDLNSNGVRDDNEPFTDIGEPFLDVNDNGEFDDGEEFIDTDSDGEWTGPNGVYDATTFITAQDKVLWTGNLEEGAEVARLETSPDPPNISDGGSASLSIYLFDANLNPIAAYAENDDYLYLQESGGYIAFLPSDEITLDDRLGMTFDDDGAILQFLPSEARIQVTLSDYSPGYVEDPVVPYTVSVSMYTSPGPHVDEWIYSSQEWFTGMVQGTVE